MRASRITAGLAALCLGVVVTAASAQKPKAESSWWPTWWGQSKPKVEAKERPKPTFDRAAELARIEGAYERWWAACDRLREIAMNTDNSALLDEVQRLNDLADSIRNARIEALDRRSFAEPEGKESSALDETPKVMLKTKAEGPRRSGGVQEGGR